MAGTVTVTCHTEGCGNAGVPIEMPSGVMMDGEWQPMGGYSCGVCGQPIEDVEGLLEPTQLPTQLPRG